MLVVLSTGMLTALTGTGLSQVAPAYADEERVCENNNNDNCNDQEIEQENDCKIVNENENGDDSARDNTNDLTCWNFAQNPDDGDAFIDGESFIDLTG